MKTLLGGILLAVGVLIAGASGLCSLVFLFEGMRGADGGGAVAGLMLVLFVGGAPFGIGVSLVIAGRSLIRNASES